MATTVIEVSEYVAKEAGLLDNHIKNCEYFWEAFHIFIGHKLNQMGAARKKHKPKLGRYISGLVCLPNGRKDVNHYDKAVMLGKYFIVKTQREAEKIKDERTRLAEKHRLKTIKKNKELDEYLKNQIEYKKQKDKKEQITN